ncbi:MAG TPA: ABC transporter ATP-binding protein [Geminicoccus sp.]|jgi:branched-chain amino acid transport system ATP-binding protein|uniref:ABC transporter ATP-binding protein n=1 Tax=Geminicoccus sp. TaxID=2024832 RepID=UPI002E30AD98|nr:ABC transporter ATP-binding protein [Geminicoccus sp.]HEX2528144.1 ABC transporter ATP-binding protein [Geminicoccus sp.]
MSDGRLRARDVSVEFSGLRALDGVSLDLDRGEIVGLIGPNGSGKTTMVNAITRQVPLAGGEVTVDGVSLNDLKPHEVARRGIVRSFQIVRLFDHLTVAENVETAALAQGHGRRAVQSRVEELLMEFGLAGRADSLASELSYGDKRRVEIARALAAEPAFLILDEPAAGMNEGESDVLLALLSALPTRRKLGLLIIDHDMALIMRLCHRLHVLASGRTIAAGSVESVRRNPAVIEAYLGSSATTAHA